MREGPRLPNGIERELTISRFGSLCIPNVSFLEHRGPEEIAVERKDDKKIPCGYGEKNNNNKKNSWTMSR